MKKIGINGGAGRIGKFAGYELIQIGEIIGAINDLASTDAIVDSLAHKDGVHGNLDWKIEKIDDENIAINGNAVRVFHEKDAADIAWGEDIKAVAECTGFYIQREASERHFAKNPGLENVLISAPGKGDMKMLVMGINHEEYESGTEMDKVVSNASCTTKALAMPMKALIDAGVKIYGVLMDTTHAATNTSKPLDFMDQYGALDNIISAKTGAAVATGKVIPYLEGKMDGFAMRVPTRDGSFANVYLVAECKDMSVEHLNDVFVQAAANPRYLGRLFAFDGAEIASPDVIGNTANAVVALSKTKSLKLPFKGENPENETALVGIVSGYDNERGPSKDLAMLIQYVGGCKK